MQLDAAPNGTQMFKYIFPFNVNAKMAISESARGWFMKAWATSILQAQSSGLSASPISITSLM